MKNLSLLVTEKELNVYKELNSLVSLIRKDLFCKSCYLYLYKYNYIIYSNFDIILYFVSNCSRSFLDSFLLDDDVDFFISFANKVV